MGTGCGREEKNFSMLEEVGWFSIVELTKIHSLVQMWKVAHLNKPENIRDKIEILEDYHVTTEPPRLQFAEHGFTRRTTRDWNLLPRIPES